MSHRRKLLPWRLAVLAACCSVAAAHATAEDPSGSVCPRPAEGSVVQEPPSVSSRDGVLDLTLKFKSGLDPEGTPRYCYISDQGLESPTLRLAPGDKLLLHLKNELSLQSPAASPAMQAGPAMAMPMSAAATGADAACGAPMGGSSTNLHFHGIALPPVCHQDESIHTLVGPGQNFDYTTQIPADNPPGLYWYHPHPHGFSEAQVQGGASGAMIVEGIQSALPELAELPERTFILRDQLLPPNESKKVDPLLPSWDVSVNYVPIKYPNYLPATIQVRPGERQLWRLVNAGANTIFNLQILYNDVPQSVEVYGVDGVPVSGGPVQQEAIFLPPGARMEFVVKTPDLGEPAALVTRKFDSGPAGDSAPARPLANIVALKLQGSTRGEEAIAMARPTVKLNDSERISLLSDVKPVRTRTLTFSQNGNGTEGGAGAADKFYITVLGQPVQAFDMSAPPNIVARQGTVEDWNLLNPTPEDHIFHMHQVHFQVIAVNGVPVDDPVMRDTTRVPHQVGRTPISSVRVRVDFREPAIVGTFVYHCHILGHEDKGMMGSIQILPAESAAAGSSSATQTSAAIKR